MARPHVSRRGLGQSRRMQWLVRKIWALANEGVGAWVKAEVRRDKSTPPKGDWSGGGLVMAPRRLASTQSFNQRCLCVR